MTAMDFPNHPGIGDLFAASNGTTYEWAGRWVAQGISGPLDVGVWFPGKPLSGETLLQFVAVRSFLLPDGLVDSEGYARIAPTAAAQVDILKNNTPIGTVDWASGVTTATFAFSSTVQFFAGDRLTLVAHLSDATWTDVTIMLRGTR